MTPKRTFFSSKLLLLFFLILPLNAYSAPKIHRIVVCKYADDDFSFSISAYMISKTTFLNSAFYNTKGSEISSSLSQKGTQGREKFYFILNEGDPELAVQVQVFSDIAPDGGEVSLATTVLDNRSDRDFLGSCKYYKGD